MKQEKHRMIITPEDMSDIATYSPQINPFEVADALAQINNYEAVTDIVLPPSYQHQQAAFDAAWKEYCKKKKQQ